MTAAATITESWQQRLTAELPKQSDEARQAILKWLVGENPDRFNEATASDLKILTQALEYRYQILHQRYWGVSPEVAYRRLIQRLSSLFLVRSKVRTWIALSRDRRRTVTDVLQEVIQEMLQSDRHLRQQVTWIGTCTRSDRIRNLLMLATLEEYCMRPIRNQPLLVYRFVNYLRRSQRGGMTQVPSGELIRLVSEEITTGDPDNSLSLLDIEAVAQYETTQQAEEEHLLREQVKQQFQTYLRDTLDATAAEWLELHLQGHTQEAIALSLNLSIKEAYRLREKIRYHAIRVYTLRENPDLVFSWLKTSLKDHNLGLSPDQWEQFCAERPPLHREILSQMKAGATLDAIAQACDMKPRQVAGEWAQIYLDAQALRSDSISA
ncbi:HetZ-related protein 2 [Leptolyngbya sp. PCC 6406]|uniref:HetZ-related protein 2 n=1 Tax=Leptolyngbya sp. PCC 6406 TaxID=1173264 RepID=UPI0002AC4040|nr:HetZ-related protein 2 [Leptolyngbya sp. PCC 6406]